MIFYIIIAIAAIWLFTIGAVSFAFGAFDTTSQESVTVANGAIYLSVLAMAMVLNVAVIVPGLLLLQPMHLWRVIRAERDAMTPRQRFRGEPQLDIYRECITNIYCSCIPNNI